MGVRATVCATIVDFLKCVNLDLFLQNSLWIYSLPVYIMYTSSMYTWEHLQYLVLAYCHILTIWSESWSMKTWPTSTKMPCCEKSNLRISWISVGCVFGQLTSWWMFIDFISDGATVYLYKSLCDTGGFY